MGPPPDLTSDTGGEDESLTPARWHVRLEGERGVTQLGVCEWDGQTGGLEDVGNILGLIKGVFQIQPRPFGRTNTAPSRRNTLKRFVAAPRSRESLSRADRSVLQGKGRCSRLLMSFGIQRNLQNPTAESSRDIRGIGSCPRSCGRVPRSPGWNALEGPSKGSGWELRMNKCDFFES